ncbi:MAG: PIG-L deacetylase family protein [Paracoccus sp. (in: a-proteobacteria)]|uniref:PIG-L deacetylase family protein n=1 Tax=Rhodobacterales TaxID=204455 RepID=UPI000C370790|nr:PIG-L deacetylase family protein [Paracoccus sp. (in: a-proteobacteria)]MBA49993.1 PIG-L family deacetylase [Paracoccus sp. (in: a-proteobacteria)]|tara:strand:+ start:5610 stop:6314 length:705 start_codon:yes stop_codon:yes gene_type:complete
MNSSESPTLPSAFRGDERIVVITPHPDDESLACGALLAHAFAGAGAHVICLTDGSASHPGSRTWVPPRLARQRHAELIDALKCLGGTPDDLFCLGLPDGRLDQADEAAISARVEQIVQDTGSRHIFASSAEDHHEDHKATASIAAAIRTRRPDWSYYSYPVWSRWDDPEFDAKIARHKPIFLEAGQHRDKKRAAIRAHRSQLGEIVTDDPSGFILPAAFIAKFIGEHEIFWRMP